MFQIENLIFLYKSIYNIINIRNIHHIIMISHKELLGQTGIEKEKSSSLILEKDSSSQSSTTDKQKTKNIEKIASNLDNKKRKRCNLDGCQKKLSLVELSISCKCEKIFCMKHYGPDEHSCGYDFRSRSDSILKKGLIQVKADKVPGRI